MCHGDETIDFYSFQSQHFFEIILSLLSIVICHSQLKTMYQNIGFVLNVLIGECYQKLQVFNYFQKWFRNDGKQDNMIMFEFNRVLYDK